MQSFREAIIALVWEVVGRTLGKEMEPRRGELHRVRSSEWVAAHLVRSSSGGSRSPAAVWEGSVWGTWVVSARVTEHPHFPRSYSLCITSPVGLTWPPLPSFALPFSQSLLSWFPLLWIHSFNLFIVGGKQGCRPLFRIPSSFRPKPPPPPVCLLLVKRASEIGFLGGSRASQIECQNPQIEWEKFWSSPSREIFLTLAKDDLERWRDPARVSEIH